MYISSLLSTFWYGGISITFMMALLVQIYIAHTSNLPSPGNVPGWTMEVYLNRYPLLNVSFILSLMSGGLLFCSIFSTVFRLLERRFGNDEERTKDRIGWMVFTMIFYVLSKLTMISSFVTFWTQSMMVRELKNDSFFTLPCQILYMAVSLLFVVGLLFDLGMNGSIIQKAYLGQARAISVKKPDENEYLVKDNSSPVV
jgi:hypothetical protein